VTFFAIHYLRSSRRLRCKFIASFNLPLKSKILWMVPANYPMFRELSSPNNTCSQSTGITWSVPSRLRQKEPSLPVSLTGPCALPPLILLDLSSNAGVCSHVESSRLHAEIREVGYVSTMYLTVVVMPCLRRFPSPNISTDKDSWQRYYPSSGEILQISGRTWVSLVRIMFRPS